MLKISETARRKLKIAIYVLPRVILMLPMAYFAYIGYPDRIPGNSWVLLGVTIPFLYASQSLIFKYAKPKDDMSQLPLFCGLIALSVIINTLFVLFVFKY